MSSPISSRLSPPVFFHRSLYVLYVLRAIRSTERNFYIPYGILTPDFDPWRGRLFFSAFFLLLPSRLLSSGAQSICIYTESFLRVHARELEDRDADVRALVAFFDPSGACLRIRISSLLLLLLLFFVAHFHAFVEEEERETLSSNRILSPRALCRIYICIYVLPIFAILLLLAACASLSLGCFFPLLFKRMERKRGGFPLFYLPEAGYYYSEFGVFIVDVSYGI